MYFPFLVCYLFKSGMPSNEKRAVRESLLRQPFFIRINKTEEV